MPGTLLTVLVSLAIGLLVNVLADRLPAMRTSPVLENSEEHPTPAPIRSRRRWVRYGIVEVILVALAIHLHQRLGTAPLAWIWLAYIGLFVLVGVIDIEHRLVLNVIMLPAFVVALVELALSRRTPLLEALAGYAVAQIVVMAFYVLGGVYLSVINRKREHPVTEVAFGFGDVTLATFCGLVVGYPRVVLMLVLMVLLGGLFALVYLVVTAIFGRKLRAYTALPYGPAILTAATLMLIWGEAMARLFGAS